MNETDQPINLLAAPAEEAPPEGVWPVFLPPPVGPPKAPPLSPTRSSHLLDYDEAADFLGLKKGTLYSLVSRKQIPHIRLSGRLVRFERAALEEFIAANRVESGSFNG